MAAIGHAIMTAHYPELAHEHSWDGQSYSAQDSQGTRCTVTFSGDRCIAGFRDDRINRNGLTRALEFFRGASPEILQLAESETLQYLLELIDGRPTPSITAAFWIEGNELCAAEPFETVVKNGAFLLHNQMQDEAAAMEAWAEYWEMSDEQLNLLTSLYQQKVSEPHRHIVLSPRDITMIGASDEVGIAESRASFLEIGIEWPV